MSTHTIEIYRLDVVNQAFTRIDILDFGYKNLTYFNRLNGVGAARFILPIQHPKATVENLRRYVNQIVIKRNDTIVWFGPITDISANYSNVSGDIVIDANTYLYHLQDRFSGLLDIYPTQDLSTIIWNQINAVQNRSYGNLLITQGSLQTSVSYAKTFEYRSVQDILIEFSNYVSGFDFSFNATTNSNNLFNGVIFNTYSPRLGQLRTDLPPLELGVNVKRIDQKTDKMIVNSGIGIGQGTGSSTLNTGSIDYVGSEQAYTRRETIQSLKNETVPAVLSARTIGYLNLYSVENFQLNLELYQDRRPFLGDYTLGDRLQLRIEVPGSNYLNITGECRVIELSVSVGDTGNEQIIPKVIVIR